LLENLNENETKMKSGFNVTPQQIEKIKKPKLAVEKRSSEKVRRNQTTSNSQYQSNQPFKPYDG
jgi:hypothetical protein